LFTPVELPVKTVKKTVESGIEIGGFKGIVDLDKLKEYLRLAISTASGSNLERLDLRRSLPDVSLEPMVEDPPRIPSTRVTRLTRESMDLLEQGLITAIQLGRENAEAEETEAEETNIKEARVKAGAEHETKWDEEGWGKKRKKGE